MKPREWPSQRLTCEICGALLQAGETAACKPFHRQDSEKLREEIRKAKEEIRNRRSTPTAGSVT
jgi:hypothetical protein